MPSSSLFGIVVRGSSRSGRYEVANSQTWAQPALSTNRLFVKDVASLTLWTFD